MSALLDRAMYVLMEQDAQAGIAAHATGATPGEDAAHETGRLLLGTLAGDLGLDVDELLEAAGSRGTLQADALLSALRLRLEGDGLELVRGATISGVLTGLRLAHVLADLTAGERKAAPS